MTDITSKEIEEILHQQGAELIGYTTINEKLKPGELSPLDLLENTKSIICFAIPIPKGILYSKSNDRLLFWRYSNMIYKSIDWMANCLCLLLEKHNHISTPIYGCFPWKIINREFKGLLSLVYWAERAGLGKLTKCGLLAHPKYGTRILLGGVITSKQFKTSNDAQQDPCLDGCKKCVEVCPVNAIDETGKVNHDLCMRTANENPLMTLLLKDTKIRESIDFETIINTVGVDDHASYACIECLKACPLNQG